MTFVIARRFGDRIVMAADTMISSDQEARPDIIPGRLKIIILNQFVTAAYAGAANQGIDAIRAAKIALDAGGGLDRVACILRDATINHANRLEFILASHLDGASLKRIWNGVISENLSRTSIGTRHLEDQLDHIAASAPKHALPIRSDEENAFHFALGQLFSGVLIAEGVGGFHVLMQGTPYGHCYLSHAGATAWDRINIGEPVTAQQLEDRRTGMTQWAYQVMGPSPYGVAVLGAAVPDAGTGYIYAPLVEEAPEQGDQPFIYRFDPPHCVESQQRFLDTFRGAINAIAARTGGGVEVDQGTPRRYPPTSDEMTIIQAHAQAAECPTRVTLNKDHLWIDVGPFNGGGRGMRVDFPSLDDDAVRVLKTTIDRLVAEQMAFERSLPPDNPFGISPPSK